MSKHVSSVHPYRAIKQITLTKGPEGHFTNGESQTSGQTRDLFWCNLWCCVKARSGAPSGCGLTELLGRRCSR